jgi:hypothetical protein
MTQFSLAWRSLRLRGLIIKDLDIMIIGLYDAKTLL